MNLFWFVINRWFYDTNVYRYTYDITMIMIFFEWFTELYVTLYTYVYTFIYSVVGMGTSTRWDMISEIFWNSKCVFHCLCWLNGIYHIVFIKYNVYRGHLRKSPLVTLVLKDLLQSYYRKCQSMAKLCMEKWWKH